jgi:hypothetical protein
MVVASRVRRFSSSKPENKFSVCKSSGTRFPIINRTLTELLNELLIEQTKNRPRRRNDNGLVETGN